MSKFAGDLIPEAHEPPTVAEFEAAMETIVNRLKEPTTMSWSFSGFGKPDAMVRAIEKANSGLTGQSKEEWEEAKPALLTLVRANVGSSIALKLDANGSASFEVRPLEHDSEGTPTKTGRVKVFGICSCQLSTLYGLLE